MGLTKGAMIRVTGFLVRRGSVADRCTHYADPYKFRVGKELLIPTGYAALVNHSMQPNVTKIIRGKKVYLQALRPIAKGEELFHSYSMDALKRFRRKPGRVRLKRT